MAVRTYVIVLLFLAALGEPTWGQSAQPFQRGSRSPQYTTGGNVLSRGTKVIPFNGSLAVSRGIKVDVEYACDSLTATRVGVGDITKAAQEGAAASGWSVNNSSPYLVAVGISAQRSTAGTMFRLQVNGGVNTTAAELLRTLGPNEDLQRDVFVPDSNYAPLIETVRKLAAKSATLLARHIQKQASQQRIDEDLDRFNDQ